MCQPTKEQESAAKEAGAIKKLYLRGTVSNSLALLVLFGLCQLQEGMAFYVAIAVGIQYVVFAVHGLPYSSEKYYDLSGSFTHFAVVAASLCTTGVKTPRQMLLSLASVVWMTRLGTFLYIRILKDGRDERFEPLKKVWLAFLGAWSIQAVWVMLIQLPLLLLNSRDDTVPFGAVDALALLLWAAGFVCECAADMQKFSFRLDAANKGRWINAGLWRYSRHPNYFGEILLWSAIALSVSVAGLRAAEPALLWAWLSPAFTCLLLLKVSGIPMVEKAGMKKWGDEPAYRHYVEKTSQLVPWFPAPEAAGKAELM